MFCPTKLRYGHEHTWWAHLGIAPPTQRSRRDSGRIGRIVLAPLRRVHKQLARRNRSATCRNRSATHRRSRSRNHRVLVGRRRQWPRIPDGQLLPCRVQGRCLCAHVVRNKQPLGWQLLLALRFHGIHGVRALWGVAHWSCFWNCHHDRVDLSETVPTCKNVPITASKRILECLARMPCWL
jgi:hypothetical protein